MIKLEINSITITQGDSGAIRFYIKDKATDYPFILQKFNNEQAASDRQRGFLFVVKDTISNKGNDLIRKLYIPDGATYSEPYWFLFENNKIIELPVSASDRETDTLYHTTVSGADVFKFYDNNTTPSEHIYDYINSSIDVQINKTDTENLSPKTYYYELSYIEGTNLDNEDESEWDIDYKKTLVESTKFIVTGALVK